MYRTNSTISTVLFFLWLFCGLSAVSASAGEEIRDSKGKDFWFTFMPNFHDKTPSDGDDSLNVYISAEEPTVGRIQYRNRNNQLITKDFSISNPSQVYTFSVFYSQVELLGFNDSGNFLNNNDHQAEKRGIRQSFHVTADKEVTVYALNYANQSSDAFIVLPTDALGYEYFVLSYPSGAEIENNQLWDNSTPSQFAIVATEDNTDIRIDLSCPTYVGGTLDTKIRQITLNQGEVYLVQANITLTDLRLDLTGTKIKASKKIAVFAGHQRATIPSTEDNKRSSRDHIVEQMPSTDTWGKSAFIVPFQQPANSPIRDDEFRILASQNSTQIAVNGIPLAQLNAGQIFQGKFDDARFSKGAWITADKPILVAQYKKTAMRVQNQGDPFMTIIPPSEQFLNAYRVVNSQMIKNKSNVYDTQCLTIVANNTDVTRNTVRMDGNQIASAAFTRLGNSDFSYTRLTNIADGVHTVAADSGVGVYIYGYGDYDSYGYVGGMKFEDLSNPDTLITYLSLTPQLEGKAGENITLTLYLDSLSKPPMLQDAQAAKFHVKMRFNSTLLTPKNSSERGKIESGFHSVAMERTYATSLRSGDTLASIPLVAALGDAEFSPLEIEEFLWIDQTGDTIFSKIVKRDGRFQLMDVWKDRAGSRLVNPLETLTLSFSTSAGQISMNVGGDWKNVGGTLILYDGMANAVRNLTTDLLALSGNTGSIPLTTAGLARGAYYARLSVGDKVIVRPLFVE